MIRRYLSVCPRETIFAAQINGTPSVDSTSGGVYAIPYDNVTTGAYTDVPVGTTVDIGSTAGARDLGSFRVRKAPTADTLYIGYTPRGDFPGGDNNYLTVRREYRVWQKLARLVGSQSNSSFTNSFEEYVDYELSYDGSNADIPPKANISDWDGNPVDPAGFVDAGETYRTVRLSGLLSTVMAHGISSTLTYLWGVVDGTITTGSGTSQDIAVQFPVGFRYISLRVEDANGTQQQMRFPIWVHDDADNRPITQFRVTRKEFDGKGWNLSFELWGDDSAFNEAAFGEGTAVCYWETGGIDDPYYGFMTREAVTLKRIDARLRIDTTGPAGILDDFDSFAFTLLDPGSTPSKWYQMQNITVDRFIHFILRNYSTYLELFNFYKSDNTDRAKELEARKASLWGQVTELVRWYKGDAGCDIGGALWLRRNYDYLSTSDRAARTDAASITGANWPLETPLETYDDLPPKVGRVDVGGKSYNGTTETFVSARAPDLISGAGKGGTEMDFQVLPTSGAETQIKALVGHEYARQNNREPNVQLALSRSWSTKVEPAWGKPVNITWSYGNPRGLTLSARKYLVKRISVQISADPRQGPDRYTYTLERVTEGEPGQLVPISQSTTPNTGVTFPGSGTTTPNTGNNNGLYPGVNNLALFNNGGNLYITADGATPGSAGGPIWTATALSSLGMTGSLIAFQVDAFSPLYLGTGSTVNGWLTSTTGIWRITDIFGSVAVSLQHTYTSGPDNATRGTLAFERGVQNWGIAAWWRGATGVRVAYTTNGSSWTEVNVAANYADSTFTIPVHVAINPHVAGEAYLSMWANTTSGGSHQLRKTSDYGANWSVVTDPNVAANLAPTPLVVPYTITDFSKVYYRRYAGGGGLDLYRVVGSGTPADLALPSGGPNNFERAIAISDANEDAAVVCGISDLGGSGAYTAYRTTNLSNASPTWDVLYAGTSSEGYTGAYITDDAANSVYLIGINGAFGYFNGASIDNRIGNISTSGVHVGLCGG